MRVVKLRTNGAIEIKHIKNELRDLENEVGGYIEKIKLFDDLILLVDDEGALKRRSINPFFTTIRGDIIVCRIKGEEYAGIPFFKARSFIRYLCMKDRRESGEFNGDGKSV